MTEERGRREIEEGFIIFIIVILLLLVYFWRLGSDKGKKSLSVFLISFTIVVSLFISTYSTLHKKK
jgi:hypothetical protein